MTHHQSPFGLLNCLLLCLLLLSLSGCETLQSRISKNQGYFGKLPDEHKQTIRQEKIKIGFTSREVYLAWGQPNHTIATESSDGSGETWLYTRMVSDVEYRNVYQKHPTTGTWLPAYEPVYIDREYIERSVTLINGLVSTWTEYSNMVPFRHGRMRAY